MDRRTWVAIVVCIVFLIAYPYILKQFGLSKYLYPERPAPAARHDSTTAGRVVGDTGATVTGAVGAAARTAPGAAAAPAPGASLAAIHAAPTAELERVIAIETPLYRVTFSNRGARIVSVELKRYTAAHGAASNDAVGLTRPRSGKDLPPGERVVLAGGPSFGLDLGSDATLRTLGSVVYATAESLDAAGDVRSVTFSMRDSSGLAIRQTYRVHPDDYALDYETAIIGVPQAWRIGSYSLTMRSWPLLNEHNLQDEERSLKISSLVGTNLHRVLAMQAIKGAKRFDGNVQWAGVQTRYFATIAAVVRGSAQGVIAGGEQREVDAEALKRLPQGALQQQPVAVCSLVMGIPSELDPVNRFTLYVGPNEFERLSRLGGGLDRVVDLGWNWIHPFSQLLLRVMIWLHRLAGNYGLAIVLLATLVRVLLHPLNMMSMRSMRSMQKIQPEVERLRKKYEHDPQAMNTAIMALYKENKVNPAGGCLPMVVQMPLFFALYAVLYNSIELRMAPFVGWINDLSGPDQFLRIAGFTVHLLPVIMAFTGFLSQRLTPTDPKQLPTMYMMNVMMLVFFYNLPSGLVLYWTVMNLLTAAQQWLVLREGGTPVIGTVAKRPSAT
ncbi:MAG: membrane protein insertase YidC [Candidatus Eisenbacteria bacterium]